MKLDLRVEIDCGAGDCHVVRAFNFDTLFGIIQLTVDEIEDLEMNLTDIIKQLQDYRLAKNES